jgi:pyridoxamine 5'-phosphate oxidase family protein
MKRSTLTEPEIAWMTSQRTGRLATVDAHGKPQNNPVSAFYNAILGTIDIGGHNMASSRKFRNAQLPNAYAALVVDEIIDNNPGSIRLLEIRGPIEAISHPDYTTANVDGSILRLTVDRVVSWGLERR